MEKPGQVLVVDDELEIRAVCERVIKQMGFEVATACDGEAALRYLEAGDFDFVLTDLSMPGPIDGRRLAEEIKHRSPSTDVVIMTAYPSLETAIPTLKGGAYDYLTKPFKMEFLRSVIAKCFERRRLSGELNREKTMRRELEASYAELQKVERVKDAIISRLSHELRTPLCSGFMALERLEARGQVLDSCRTLRSSLSRLRDTVEELLLFAQVAHEDKVLNKESLNLRKLVEGVVDTYRPLWSERGLEVKTEWTALESLDANRKRLELAIKHLFLNAVYFNRKGGRVLIEGRALADGAYISFSDTGIGIPREKLPQLFDGFYQAAEHLTREVGGLGLGLAIVRRIAESHGGSIWVESEEGKGSTFILKLPAEAATKHEPTTQKA